MIQEIDEFISFMMDHKDDERVTIEKDIKYGHKNYWITFNIDGEPPKSKSQHWGVSLGRLSIHFDCRNECVVFSSDTTSISQITIEDTALLKKWCDIIEEHISKSLKSDFREMIENTLAGCHNKDIHREWKMKKIFDEEDESL